MVLTLLMRVWCPLEVVWHLGNTFLKSHKYGCKLYKLCMPIGYTLNLKLYVGAGECSPPLSIVESLTVRLMKNHLDMGVTLLADNFHTSNFLAEYLLQHKTYLCGTVRVNRKNLPKTVLKSKLKRSKIKALESDKGVKIFNWKDKRNVVTLLTVPEHDDALVDTGQVSIANEPIKKPQSVLDYTKCKRGVDLSDQMSCYYSPLKKTRKWYKKVAFKVIAGTSVVNAWVLCNQYYAPKTMPIRNFRESIVLALTRGINEEASKPEKSSLNISETLSLEHILVEAEGSKRQSHKHRKSCYEMLTASESSKMAKNKARKISTYCNACEGSPYLCILCLNMKHGAEY